MMRTLTREQLTLDFDRWLAAFARRYPGRLTSRDIGLLRDAFVAGAEYMNASGLVALPERATQLNAE